MYCETGSSRCQRRPLGSPDPPSHIPPPRRSEIPYQICYPPVQCDYVRFLSSDLTRSIIGSILTRTFSFTQHEPQDCGRAPPPIRSTLPRPQPRPCIARDPHDAPRPITRSRYNASTLHRDRQRRDRKRDVPRMPRRHLDPHLPRPNDLAALRPTRTQAP